jgi:hypothetical protein
VVAKYTVQIQAYLRSKRVAQTIGDAIDNYERQTFDLERRLERERDPEVRAQIQGKIAEFNSKIGELERQLEENGRAIGSLISITVTAT